MAITADPDSRKEAAPEGYGYEVNGRFIPTEDRLLKGRDVRIGADLNPAADWRLCEVKERYTTSVGLEDPIELKAGRVPIFVAAEGDRDYDFTVDDLGWEWPSPTINEAEIRRYGRISDDRDLVVEGPEERIVPRGGTIDLAGNGVERIYSRKAVKPPVPDVLKLIFIVGGEPHETKAKASETLRDVLARVLTETEHVGRLVDDWQVTDVPGKAYDLATTLVALGIHDGMELVASLKTGEAG